MKDRRAIDRLLTVEWHAGYVLPFGVRRWRTAKQRSRHGQFQPRFDTVIFNFADMWDNVKISARGFDPDGVRRLAEVVGIQFTDFSSTTGNAERDHVRLQRIAQRRARQTRRQTKVAMPPRQ